MFKLKDTVSWQSQGQGNATVKSGYIVYVLPPKTSPARVVSELKKTHRVMFKMADRTFAHGRDHESYLVSVERGSTEKAFSGLYWPDMRRLRKVTL